MTVELVEEVHNPSFDSLKQRSNANDTVAAAMNDVSPEQLAFVVARLKSSGNEAFQAKRYREAVRLYDQAIAGAPKDATLLGNRSAAYLALGLYQEAAADAQQSIALDGAWPKGHYRLGCAQMALGEWSAAAEAFAAGLALAPGNRDMSTNLKEARRQEAEEAAARRTQQGMARRDLAVKLRGARRQDARLAALNQVKQSMAAPDWELDDFEWRPTFRPSMTLAHQPHASPEAAARRAALAAYINALADLAAPKKALPILSDVPRLDAFNAGIRAALQQKPDAHVLVLGAGTGMLPLMAAASGAGSVTAVERTRMLYRMARQVLDANAAAPNADRIRLIDRKLRAIGIAGEQLPPGIEHAAQQLAAHSRQTRRSAQQQQQSASASTPGAAASSLQPSMATGSQPAPPAGDATDAPSATGQDLKAPDASRAADGHVMSAPRTAAEAALAEKANAEADGLENDVRCISAQAAAVPDDSPIANGQDTDAPPCIDAQVAAALLDAAAVLPSRADVLVTDLFDHSVLGMGILPAIDYAAARLLTPCAVVVPGRVQVYAMLVELRLGEVAGFDLSVMDAYRWHPHIERIDLDRVPRKRLSQPFLAFGFDLQQRAAAAAATGSTPAAITPANAATSGAGAASGRAQDAGCKQLTPFGDGKHRFAAAWEHDETLRIKVDAAGRWNAVAFWFELDMGCDSGSRIASWQAGDSEGSGPAPVGTSWQQSVQYLDGMTVQQGETVEVRVRQDAGQLHFASELPARRPRHAFLPRWHFDMLHDAQRNAAYQTAIEHAVALKRAAGCSHILALDIGAGSGLLSMMAARAGADQVVAAEMSGHMADAGGEVVAANGFGTRIMMIDKDARRMDVVRKPDGTPPDMERKADILVYEVFDSGLIGEGALHALAAARQKLVAPDAVLVPAAATVFAQPLQLRRHSSVRGFDVSAANQWHWRPDYEGVELALCRSEWRALGPVIEVMGFDFYDDAANMAPAAAALTARISEPGIWNAVAFWFELQLDEDTRLDTSPYCDKGATWQQAVQWMGEVRVSPGMRLPLTARHDTYGISFSRGAPDETAAAAGTQDFAGDAAPLLAAEPTGVPLQDPLWETAFKRMSDINGQLAKSCVQNPLEFRSVASAAVAFGARPRDFGLDTDQAVDFCTKMMA